MKTKLHIKYKNLQSLEGTIHRDGDEYGKIFYRIEVSGNNLLLFDGRNGLNAPRLKGILSLDEYEIIFL